MPDSKFRTISFIGSGQMALAMASGVASRSLFDKFIFCDVYEKAAKKCEQAVRKRCPPEHHVEAHSTTHVEECFADSRVVVIAVKPSTARALLPTLRRLVNEEHLVISIMAGWSLDGLRSCLGPKPKLVRVMPNTPLLAGHGCTAFATSEGTTGPESDLVQKIFSSCGFCRKVDESLMDAVTGTSGSGPAYVAIVIEALSDAAVKQGIPRELANRLAAHTVMGTGALCLIGDTPGTMLHPAELKDRVSSPGGTTIHGIAALEARAVRAAFIEAVAEATARSLEMGAPPKKKDVSKL